MARGFLFSFNIVSIPSRKGLQLIPSQRISGSCYALVAGTAGILMRRNARIQRGGQLVSGGAYIALGATAALVGDRPARAT